MGQTPPPPLGRTVFPLPPPLDVQYPYPYNFKEAQLPENMPLQNSQASLISYGTPISKLYPSVISPFCIFLFKDRMVVIIKKNCITETPILAYFKLWKVLSFTCRTECFKSSLLPNYINEWKKLDK